MKVTFNGPIARRRRRGKCPVCGKSSTRSRIFQHTVNPFNRRPDGTPKTYAEVSADVQAEADAWTPDFTHSTCKETA